MPSETIPEHADPALIVLREALAKAPEEAIKRLWCEIALIQETGIVGLRADVSCDDLIAVLEHSQQITNCLPAADQAVEALAGPEVGDALERIRTFAQDSLDQGHNVGNLMGIRDEADRLLAGFSAASIPQPEPAAGGWVTVPRGPTEAMLSAGRNAIAVGSLHYHHAADAYRAMIAASPSDDAGSHLPPLIAEFERREDHFRERYGSGKWMVLWGDGLRWTVGDSFAEAADWALKKFGPNPRVLIRQIDALPVIVPFVAASPSPPGLDEGGVEAAAEAFRRSTTVSDPKQTAVAIITAYLEATHGR